MQFLRRVIGLEDSAVAVEGKLMAPAHVWRVVVQGDTLHAACKLCRWHPLLLEAGRCKHPLAGHDDARTRGHRLRTVRMAPHAGLRGSAGADGCVRQWHTGEEVAFKILFFECHDR